MDNQTPPTDDNPSDMTDFEKNTASEEREEDPHTPDLNPIRQDRGNDGPEKQPGSAQGAMAADRGKGEKTWSPGQGEQGTSNRVGGEETRSKDELPFGKEVPGANHEGYAEAEDATDTSKE